VVRVSRKIAEGTAAIVPLTKKSSLVGKVLRTLRSLSRRMYRWYGLCQQFTARDPQSRHDYYGFPHIAPTLLLSERGARNAVLRLRKPRCVSNLGVRPMSTALHLPLYSTLANDPDLAEIVEMFVDEMPGRIAHLVSCYAGQDWEGLDRAAHQLKGSAGSYGFHPVTDAAARLEGALRNPAAEDRIASAFRELVELCQCIQAGAPSHADNI
jgi:HPt (histidine-containing phosphotransfer) domain-containing protein